MSAVSSALLKCTHKKNVLCFSSFEPIITSWG